MRFHVLPIDMWELRRHELDWYEDQLEHEKREAEKANSKARK